MPSLLSCSLSLNLLALWANNTTVSCCNLWTILNIKLNNTELNDTLWNFASQTFNNRPHNGVQMPCLLHPLAELPPFSLTSKANPIDNPSTIMSLLRTPLHTTFQYTTRRSIKAKIGYQTPEWPTWDQEGTQSTFSMMMRYDVRDVGRKDISLGIVTKNINMMWSNTSQLLGKRIWWNWHMLLTGTTINENTQDFKQGRSGPSQKLWSPTTANPFLLSSIWYKHKFP